MSTERHESRKTRKQRHSRERRSVLSRRRFLIGASIGLPVIVVGAYGAITGFFGEKESILSKPVKITNAEVTPFPNETVLEKETEQILSQANLSGEKIKQETQRWKTAYPLPKKELPLNEKTFEEGKSRFMIVMDRMKRSENPYFKNAATLLERLLFARKASLVYYPQLTKDDDTGILGTTIKMENDAALHIEVGISLDQVLNALDPTTLALAITHEVDHIERILELERLLTPSFSPRQIRQQWHDASQIEVNKVEEEALAYGKQAQAFIYQYALGFRTLIPEHKNDAIKFIRCGKDAKSSCWQEYVRKEILRLPTLTPTQSSPYKEPIPAGEQIHPNQLIIEQEINRLGIKPSEREQQLWITKGYARSPEKLPINESTIKEAQIRVATTLTLMQQSENPYFKDAALFFKSHLLSKEVSHSLYPKSKVSKDGTLSMSTLTKIKDDKLEVHIAIAIEEVLNESDSVTLASQLTHEIEHVRNTLFYLESFPSLSPDEKVEKERQRRQDPIQHVEEEARGYGKGIQAYIYEAGLLGYITSGGSDEEKRTIAFIKSGSDVNSVEWKKYVRTEILELPTLTPTPSSS